jgi:hypothetical protein
MSEEKLPYALTVIDADLAEDLNSGEPITPELAQCLQRLTHGIEVSPDDIIEGDVGL